MRTATIVVMMYLAASATGAAEDENKPAAMSGQDKESDREAVLRLWDRIYVEELYRRLAVQISRDFIEGKRLLASGGGHDESLWTVVQPVQLGTVNWQVKVLRFVTAVEVASKRVYITFVRLVPDQRIKTVLRQNNQNSKKHGEAMAEYGLAMIGDKALELKVDLAATVNSVFDRKEYLFFPLHSYFGLFETLDYDVILPFISATSYKGKL